MQIDSHIHKTNESLKCLLFDCYSSNQQANFKGQRAVLNGNGYIIKTLNQMNAEIYVFSHEYSQTNYIVKFEEFSSIKCIRFIRLKDYSLVLYANHLTITLKITEHQSKNETIIHQEVGLRKGEEFSYFSDFMRMRHYQLLIGYTTFNQFYLVTIKDHKSFEIFKLQSKNQTLGFLSWLKSNTIYSQYKNVFLQPYRIDEGDKFILLFSLKDKTMSVHLLQLYPQQHRTSIEILGTCQPLQKIIPNSAVLQQVVITSKDSQLKHLDCLISYQLKEGFMLVLSANINHRKKNIFQINVIFEDLPSNHFSMNFYHSNILYTYFNPQENLYKVFKKKHNLSQQKRHADNKQVELFLSLKQRPYFFNVDDQLFINTSSQVYSIQAEHIIFSEQSDLSELQQHLASFKNQINYTYRKQVHKLLKKNPVPIDQLAYLLTQKCRKIIEWIKDQFSEFSLSQQHTYLILTLEITITIAIKNLLIRSSIDQILSIILEKHENFSKKQLLLILTNCQISTVINLFNMISQIRPQLVCQVLQEFQSQSEIRENCHEAIKTVFMDSYEIIYMNIEASHSIYEQVINKIIAYDLGNVRLYQQLHTNNETLFKACVIQYRSINIFIETFFIVDYKPKEVKQFVHQIYQAKRENAKKLIIQLLVKCKRLFRKKQLLFEKVDLLLEGFAQYCQQFIPQMKKIFPGVLFFYYFRIGYRKQGYQYLKEISKKHSESFIQQILSTTLKQQAGLPNYEHILNIGVIEQESSSEQSIGEKRIKKI